MSKTILVIDDEPGIRTMIDFELNAKGYDVLAVESGEDALKAFAAKKVDLVITDMRMPGMDGLDTVIEIRKKDARVPIVLMTGYMEDRVQKAVDHNVAVFLQKPFTLDELIEAVDHSLPPAA